MPPGIGASGFAGLALEATPGTYVAPTKFFPMTEESLQYQQENDYRRPIRQSADVIGAVLGNAHIEGDVTMEALSDVVPYFLDAARGNLVKTGVGPFTYTFTPNAVAIPNKTLSLTVVRNGSVFGYTGCIVAGYNFSIEDTGKLMFKVSVLGLDEAAQSLPTATWGTSVPFGAGMYNFQIPTASQIFDADTFELDVNDNADAQYRLKNTGRGAQFVAFGEREANIKTERDFITRTEYDAFKAGTVTTITFQAIQDVNNEIDIVGNVGIRDTYEVNLGGQGDLLRASIQYNLMANASGVPHTIVVKTPETFTP
jgi:hypothetical protein